MHRFIPLITSLLLTATAWAAQWPISEQPDDDDNEHITKIETNTERRHYDGIDISDHQKRIDWAEVAKDKNVQYVFIKATEGATYVSNLYRYNLENARKHGIKVGSYHFLRTGSRIRDQFANFTRVVKKSEQDLLPVIDVEVRQGWTNQQLRDSVKLFADLVEQHYGCRPLIYTSSSFYDNILGRSFNIYPLFIARYSNTEPTLKSGNDWVMWQFSERGRIRGISTNVDLSRFNNGRSLADIMIRGQRIGHKKRTNTDLVDKNVEKPTGVKVKEAPTMSKQQEKELKKRQEREQKARERAQKLAQEEAKKKAEQERKQQEKERKQKEKELKKKQEQNAKEQEHQLQLQKRAAEQKLKEQQEAAKKQEEEAKRAAKKQRQEAAKQAQKQQAQQSAQQLKKQEQQAKLEQQRQQSQTQNLPTRTRASVASSQQKNKKTNKSSADND
ncbi:MAG: hypothetical protein IJ613_00645 [Muribaculaceae bacterium]|nr:hypothetical protein [Muribaculaceae bacterium]